MLGPNLIHTLAGLVVAFGISFSVGWHYGDKYGANARAYAAVVDELNRKNAELVALRAKDDAELEAERKAADQAFDEASAALLRLGTCPATKAQADLINRVGG